MEIQYERTSSFGLTTDLFFFADNPLFPEGKRRAYLHEKGANLVV